MAQLTTNNLLRHRQGLSNAPAAAVSFSFFFFFFFFLFFLFSFFLRLLRAVLLLAGTFPFGNAGRDMIQAAEGLETPISGCVLIRVPYSPPVVFCSEVFLQHCRSMLINMVRKSGENLGFGDSHSRGGAALEVCRFWKKGRCTRPYCRFLHSDPTPAVAVRRSRSVWMNPSAITAAPSRNNVRNGKPKVGAEDREGQRTKRGILCRKPDIKMPDNRASDTKNAGDVKSKAEAEHMEDEKLEMRILCRNPDVKLPDHVASGTKNAGDVKCKAEVEQGEGKQPERTLLCHEKLPEHPKNAGDANSKVEAEQNVRGVKRKAEAELGESKPPKRRILCHDKLTDHGASNTRAVPCVEESHLGPCFTDLTTFMGHKNAVTAMALHPGTNTLVSGSVDGTVRCWDCSTKECIHVVNLGGEVACLITVESRWLFVGFARGILAYNFAAGELITIKGEGQVLAMEMHKDVLFAGAEDGMIYAFKCDAQGNQINFLTRLSGHKRPVMSVVVCSTTNKLFSSSMDCTIRVWDAESFRCLQILSGHESGVMSLYCWKGFLFSCSLDKTIKVWAWKDGESVDTVYTHREDHGLLKLGGIDDCNGEPLLVYSRADGALHIASLPSFSERDAAADAFSPMGKIRSFHVASDGLLFAGSGSGGVGVWKSRGAA